MLCRVLFPLKSQTSLIYISVINLVKHLIMKPCSQARTLILHNSAKYTLWYCGVPQFCLGDGSIEEIKKQKC